MKSTPEPGDAAEHVGGDRRAHQGGQGASEHTRQRDRRHGQVAADHQECGETDSRRGDQDDGHPAEDHQEGIGLSRVEEGNRSGPA